MELEDARRGEPPTLAEEGKGTPCPREPAPLRRGGDKVNAESMEEVRLPQIPRQGQRASGPGKRQGWRKDSGGASVAPPPPVMGRSSRDTHRSDDAAVVDQRTPIVWLRLRRMCQGRCRHGFAIVQRSGHWAQTGRKEDGVAAASPALRSGFGGPHTPP